jgi:cytosolic carboxypeptidase protein 2/3
VITSPDGTQEQKQKRKGVFLSARIHPGESVSSFMMKGVIDFLMSDLPEARLLRNHFVFKIVPMINIDGVVNGNYRCSLAGADLNRRWKRTEKELFPVVHSIKKLCDQMASERQMVLYCDFHGHSRQKNVFMFGNNYANNPESTRFLPFIMSKLCKNFSFEHCSFVVRKSKEATARISMWKMLKIPAVYTLEASFCGADIGPNAGYHFEQE